ncbi:MAG: DNA replication and repair protein RecF [Candidatus Paceibacterota bacterium]
MKVAKIFFQHFRLFTQQEVNLNDVTLLSGDNGVGKTSIIEGLYLLSHGESFRADKIDEMVAFDQELARVGITLIEEDKTLKKPKKDILEVTLTRGLVQGARTRKRLFSINGVGKSQKNFVGEFQAIVFQPEDMRLVEGSPGRRRSFIDEVLKLTNQEYVYSLHTYEQALKRLNKFLEQVREGEQPRSVLKYWEMLLIKHGEILQTLRADFFEFLRRLDSPFDFNVRYLISEISEKALESRQERAIAAGHVLVGPHKDDFEILFTGEKLDNRELSVYGSRGQQRLGVLWLKFGELKFLEKKREQKPLLLLDDIFSELDEDSENLVLELIDKYQTVITTANENTREFLKKKFKNLTVIELEN